MSLLTGLSAYYKLDEASGNAVASVGTNLSALNAPTSVAGVVNTCRSFAQPSSQAFIQNSLPEHQTGDIDFSIAAWCRLFTKGADRTIVSKYSDTAADREYVLRYDSANDRFAFDLFTSGGVISTALANTFGSPSTGVFYHVVARFNASTNLQKIVVNAGTADFVGGVTPQAAGSAQFRIGARQSATPNFWYGAVDEVGIWKKELDATEISRLYNGGLGHTYPFGGVVCRMIEEGLFAPDGAA